MNVWRKVSCPAGDRPARRLAAILVTLFRFILKYMYVYVYIILKYIYVYYLSRSDGVVGIETRYRLESPRIQSQWETGPGAHPASYKTFPGVKRPGRDINHPPPCSAEVKEGVKLYIYYPSAYKAWYRLNFLYANL